MANDYALYIAVDRDGWTGGIQISLDVEVGGQPKGGYRIAGPKFNGSSKLIKRAAIGLSEAKTIRNYMDKLISSKEKAADSEGEQP